jgi:uncharacterized protein YukE
MSTFRVRAASLGEVSAQLNGVLAVFDAHVAEVTSAASSVAGASWTGEDTDAFQESWTQWQQTSVAVRGALTALSVALAAADGAYTTTESSINSDVVRKRQADRGMAEDAEDVLESVEAGQDAVLKAQQAAAGGPAAGLTSRTGRGGPTTSGTPATSTATSTGEKS